MPESSTKSNSLPWVEKYRPKCLDDLISHKDIISTIQKFIHEDRLPHLLFYGPAGTGKTSTILAVAKQLYGPKEFASMVLELNASDDRGIGIIRNEIQTFAGTRTIFKSKFKMVILDEADAMTNDAQNALRRVMEKYTENTRFCLICNYLTGIIPAIQSRCTRFRFGPLAPDQMLSRLDHVIAEERLTVSDDGKQCLMRLSNGDMRKVLNVLQSTAMAHDEVTEETVYLCTGQPTPSDIQSIVEWMLNEGFNDAFQNIRELMKSKGMALQDIITEVHRFLHRIEFPTKTKIQLLTKLADVEYRLASGTSDKLQLSSVIAAFQVARENVVAEAS